MNIRRVRRAGEEDLEAGFCHVIEEREKNFALFILIHFI